MDVTATRRHIAAAARDIDAALDVIANTSDGHDTDAIATRTALDAARAALHAALDTSAAPRR
jgi:hypothetical protein